MRLLTTDSSLSWSKAQLEARSCEPSLDVQRFLLSLFNKDSASNRTVSLSTPLTYCDRLRIRNPGDSRFALGAHVDGGSVERWEDPTYRRSYQAILEGRWRDHDAWDIGKSKDYPANCPALMPSLAAGRPTANQNLYDGPGAVSKLCREAMFDRADNDISVYSAESSELSKAGPASAILAPPRVL